MYCPQCGNANDNAAKFCSGCSSVLLQSVQIASNNESKISALNNLGEFYKAIIGPKSQDYYLDRFSRFDRKGHAGISWHWPALFVAFYWFLYRKMWRNALIYFLLPYLFLILIVSAGIMAGKSAGTIVSIGYWSGTLAMFFLPALYANALYYKHCRKKISEVAESSRSVERQLGELSGRGGTSNVMLFVVLGLVLIAMVGVLAAVAIPQYQAYVTRARLAAAVTAGTNATASVSSYYYQYHQIPDSLAQAGYAAPLPQGVKEIDVNNQNGIVTITMSSPIEGKTVLLVPSVDANQQIIWKCTSSEIAARQLPQQCRQ